MPHYSPFFIVGVPRSGTTLLAVLLNNHSQIYVGKVALGLSLLKLQRRHMESYSHNGDMRSRTASGHLLAALKSEPLVWQFCQNVANKADEGLCSVLAHACQDAAQRHGKVIWGNKSPFMLTEFPRIAHLMPGARFIHVIRDGRAVALSRYERRHLPLKLAIHIWKQMILKGQIDGEILGPERYIEIRYKDLVEKSTQVLDKVCTFLGVEFEGKMLALRQPGTTDQPSTYVRPELDQKRIDSWKERLSPQSIECLEAIAGDLLQTLGYELRYYSPEGAFKALSPLEIVWYNELFSLRDLLQAKRVAMINQQLVEVTIPLPTRVRRFLSASAAQFLSDRMIEQFRGSKIKNRG